jgi:hypothetical protein
VSDSWTGGIIIIIIIIITIIIISTLTIPLAPVGRPENIDLHQLGAEDWEIIYETEDEDRCATRLTMTWCHIVYIPPWMKLVGHTATDAP